MSWTKRQNQRGANMKLFRPPAELAPYLLWHLVNTHRGQMRLRFHPGIDVWKDAEGQRWTAEYAGDMNWGYVALVDELPAKLAVADPGKVRLCGLAPSLGDSNDD
jgi:hypothetical protein